VQLGIQIDKLTGIILFQLANIYIYIDKLECLENVKDLIRLIVDFIPVKYLKN